MEQARRSRYSAFNDIFERVAWTALQGAVGVISVEMFNLPVWAVLPVATGISLLKNWIATKVTDNGTASTAPGV